MLRHRLLRRSGPGGCEVDEPLDEGDPSSAAGPFLHLVGEGGAQCPEDVVGDGGGEHGVHHQTQLLGVVVDLQFVLLPGHAGMADLVESDPGRCC